MTEQEWFQCANPKRMLEFLKPTMSSRKLGLFACACCRRVEGLINKESTRKAIEMYERHWDGLEQDIEDARIRFEVGAESVADDAVELAGDIIREAIMKALEEHLWCLGQFRQGYYAYTRFDDEYKRAWKDAGIEETLAEVVEGIIDAWTAFWEAWNSNGPRWDPNLDHWEEAWSGARNAMCDALKRIWDTAWNSIQKSLEEVYEWVKNEYADWRGRNSYDEHVAEADDDWEFFLEYSWYPVLRDDWEKVPKLIKESIDATLDLASARATICKARASVLRDIVGNPFRSVSIPPSWLTHKVRSLAQSIYDELSFEKLPVLADALEEAGCDNADVLTHCRNGGTHVRGCWLVDLLLGKQ